MGAAARRAPSPPTVGKIRHVVVIFQENRTPDNLFQDPVLMAKGAEIATSGLNSSGNTIPLVATPLGIDYDLSHSHGAFVAMYDGGKMDGADKIEIRCGASSNCPPPNPQFMYVQASDVGPLLFGRSISSVHLICFRDFVTDSRTFARAHLCFVYSIQVDSGLVDERK
jgi:hypothetical protein